MVIRVIRELLPVDVHVTVWALMRAWEYFDDKV